LVWNNASYWWSLRALEILYAIPILGSFFSFLAGGLEVASLSRFYFFHIVLLPALFWFGLYISFSGIRKVGLSELQGERQRKGRAAYLSHLYSLLVLFLVVFGVLVTMSVVWPVSFGTPVDPFRTPSGSMMPWYLLAPYGFVEFFPRWIPLWIRSSVLLVLLTVFVFFPFLDPQPVRSEAKAKWVLIFGIAVAALWVFFTFYGLLLDVPG
jgi:quinol-cytochrome oxidoreductase complex cytochrome b subunit